MKTSRRKKMPTQERLQFLLTYDAKTGNLWRKTRPITDFHSEGEFKTWNKRFSNKQAGVPANGRYLAASIDGTNYCCQCLVWIYHYGDIPDGMEIDHIDGNGHNNRLCNLETKTHQSNQKNQTKRKNNTSGFPGVHFCIGNKFKNKPWMARIWKNGKRKNLGVFHTAIEAHERYTQEAKLLGFSDRHIYGK